MVIKYRAVPWKRNINKVPEEILAELNEHADVDYIAGITKAFAPAALSAGVLGHLGITATTTYPVRIMPDVTMGRYSKKNAQGWIGQPRKDLPKETYSFDTPYFGDWSLGYHTHYRERWQRDVIEPPTYEIVVEHLGDTPDGNLVLKASIDAPKLDVEGTHSSAPLFLLNLLQENFGVCGVLPRHQNVKSLFASHMIDWEIFPFGEADDVVVKKLISKMRNPSAEHVGVVQERAEMFRKLGGQMVIGSSGFNRYIGAKFADDLVVFENVRYGNALYVLYGNWQQVSQLSRVDLLRAGTQYAFTRFIHRQGWKNSFINHITAEKAKRGLAA